MNKGSFDFKISKNIDDTLSNLYISKEPPKWTLAIVFLLYILANLLVVKTARSTEVLLMFGTAIPFSIFTGVFSSLTNIFIIFMVVFYRKLGFISAVTILAVQFPIIAVNLFVRHVTASIPGIFTNLFTILACVIIYANKTVIENYQKRFRQQAVSDHLTDLPNRFACTEFMEDLIRHNVNFVIVSIDLNNFKSINDTMGHEIGDIILIELALRWKDFADSHKTNTHDFIARLSGDEFAIIIRGYKTNEELMNTINAYKAELEQTFTIDNCDYFMTASFGYAKFPEDADNSTSLFSCADAAMHELKRRNTNNHILRFKKELLTTELIFEMERKIRIALDNDGVFFYLQPQYDLDHKLRGFEALARMKDTDGSLISPASFIPVAEKTGLIEQIDMSVFRKAVKFLEKVLEKNDSNITVSFNVSVKHLMKNNFIDEIREVIDNSTITANHLEMEITESIMIDSAEKALQRINEIKKMGIQVAIDDFGTGYSSLSYLNKLPSDLLKIDKSFIDALNTNESSKQYVASIVLIGHVLNLKVISEGVEHPEQLETLRDIGCDYIQGYIWGKPLPPEEAAALL